MGHKEWETDDFLDEFLDFDYRKPVPDHAEGKHSRGLPAEEAILQMEMLGHDFFVFLDMDTDAVSVVYKRKGGEYGLIETDRR